MKEERTYFMYINVSNPQTVGREEIEEMEEDSTKIGRQRSKDGALKQAKYAPGRPPGRPVEKAGRPACTTCTGSSQLTARSTD